MRKITSSITTVVVVSLLLALGMAAPANADDYPSWADVQAAQQNEAAKNAEIAKIEGLLTTLEADADALSKVAQQKGEEYNTAKVSLDASTSKAAKLQDQVKAAQQKADLSARRAGQLVAQIARTGGGSATLGILLSHNAGDLLSSIGTMTKLTEQSSTIYRQAITDKNLTASLTDQAKVAEAKRQTLASAAQQALAAAKSAADAAQAKVAVQQAAADQMYSQLASLKGTTADIEAGYAAGTAAAPTGGGAAPSTPPAPGSPSGPPPAPDSSAVSIALNFAYAQLGKMYEFAGSGPDTWDCSGLTQAAYSAAGIYIGQHSVTNQYYTLANQARLAPISQMVPGDLIFYADGDGFYHVTIYIGGGQMIEAPRDGIPVRIASVRYSDAVSYVGRPAG
ncbi:MAG: NlpC/P60 family protein [Rhodoglobus sp.]